MKTKRFQRTIKTNNYRYLIKKKAMNKKQEFQQFQDVIEANGIKRVYHFTDFDNLESIINNGGLYSWADCNAKEIKINRPGGDPLSHNLDSRDNLEGYVRVSFTRNHPMMFTAMKDGRISNPVVLEIDPEVIWWEDTLYADRNMVRTGAQVGGSLSDLKRIHFDTVKQHNHFDLSEDEKKFYQAEVLVKHFIPLSAIKNIGNFGMPIPSQPKKLQSRQPYTAQITRSTPTAFIFLVDHSVSMKKRTSLYGEEMPMSEAVARIVNKQIDNLVLRCIKTNEVRHYYDIAVIGYGDKVYSGWQGSLAGRDFVSPLELRNNPFKKIKTLKEMKTRKGVVTKEVEEVQWVEARNDGHWTYLHNAFDYAKNLLEGWMAKHHEQDCYPPTIIHITDGEFNGAPKEVVLQKANELKSMFTNDGNVILFNIHISADRGLSLSFPTEKGELLNNEYGKTLFEMSSLLPLRYNEDIARVRDNNSKIRHSAMAVNADMGMLIQLMDIGTPTNISQSK